MAVLQNCSLKSIFPSPLIDFFLCLLKIQAQMTYPNEALILDSKGLTLNPFTADGLDVLKDFGLQIV